MKPIKPFRYSLFLAAVLMASSCRDKDLATFNSLEKDRFLVKTEKAGVQACYLWVTTQVQRLKKVHGYLFHNR